MLSVNRINGTENFYANQNKQISFKSKFVPNDALKDAFYIAEVSTKFAPIHKYWEIQHARFFARIVDYLLKDGKDDLIKVTRSKTASSLTINGNRVNLYREMPESPGFVDGGRVINNFVDYFFTKKEIIDPTNLSRDEFKAIKPAVDKLNTDLDEDDVIKNPSIFYNLIDNMNNINGALRNNTLKLLENLESKIFIK